jgi:hypothetical protein
MIENYVEYLKRLVPPVYRKKFLVVVVGFSSVLRLVAVVSAMRWMCDDVVEGQKRNSQSESVFIFLNGRCEKVRTRYFLVGFT